jgi:hypothetical protein
MKHAQSDNILRHVFQLQKVRLISVGNCAEGTRQIPSTRYEAGVNRLGFVLQKPTTSHTLFRWCSPSATKCKIKLPNSNIL